MEFSISLWCTLNCFVKNTVFGTDLLTSENLPVFPTAFLSLCSDTNTTTPNRNNRLDQATVGVR